MKKLIGLVLFLISLPVAAQEEREMHWENVTTLNFVAKNGSDKEHALQQYLLFDEAVLDRNRELLEEYKTVHEEFFQMSLNKEAPQMNKAIDEMIANAKQTMKEHPELAAELREQLKEVERMRGEYNSHADNEVTEYTYDPKEILRKLTAIAVGKRTYTGFRDIGNGLFAVKTGACFGPLEPDAFKRVNTPEKNEYTWGAIDYDGHVIMEPIYQGFSNHFTDDDIIFLVTKDKNGIAHDGALGYDGRVRIPFVYDCYESFLSDSGRCIMCKNGKLGIITVDNQQVLPFEYTKIKGWVKNVWLVSKDGKNFGIMDGNMKIVIPLKYEYVWDSDDKYLEMLRFDKQIDVYDKVTFKFVRTKPNPNY